MTLRAGLVMLSCFTNVLVKAYGLAALVVGVSAWGAMAGVLVCNDGTGRFRIVVASEAIPSERYAAEELQRYLERISGAKLPIVSDEEPMTSHEILLGDNLHLRKLRLRIDFARLGTDGFTLRTHRSYIIIAGGKPRGTLYGVYALLEEKLGVRWFTIEVESVPKRQRLELPNLMEVQVPVLEYRDTSWYEMRRHADFSVRHRLNGWSPHISEKHGGIALRFAGLWVHSLDALVPPELYNEHPEYFPLIDGKRVNRPGCQRCLSNPDVLNLVIKGVRQWLDKAPWANVVSVSQNDEGGWCQCPQCKQLWDMEGSLSGPMLAFVNAVAEAIEEDHPNVMVDTLAYKYTQTPPKTIRPHRNVLIRLCPNPYRVCYAHPLATCSWEANQQFRQDIATWQCIAPKLYIWDYTLDYAYPLQPYPNLDALGPNMQFFAGHGVKGVFSQGDHLPSGSIGLGPLKAYLIAKLLWNPNTDIGRHINEFLKGYYGRAAGAIRAYIELLQRQVREKGYHAFGEDPPKAPYLNDELLEGAERLFDEAERLAESEEIRLRVQMARLPIWYVKLETKRVSGEARKDLLGRFLAISERAGLKLDDWAKRMAEE